MKPLIGINMDIVEGTPEQVCLNATYVRAIEGAGGIPVLIPPMSDENLLAMRTKISGLVLVGGKDYDPKIYGAPAHEKTNIAHSWRQEFDVKLAARVLLETNLPVLGICAGHQLINIVLGGTLIQDLESDALSDSAVEHRQEDHSSSMFTRHEIEFQDSSAIKEIYGASVLEVPSSHHQAIASLGKGLVVTSKAADGVIESIELPERGFTIGVQWHPERDLLANASLFDAFLQAAKAAS